MGDGHAESVVPSMGYRPPAGSRSPSIHPDLNHDEIRAVLGRYDLGVIHKVTDLRAGSVLSPKAIVDADRGKMLLKRRARGLDIPTVVAFAHEVLCGCLRGGLCVPPLVGTKDENNSMVQMHDHVYELFVFVEGVGYAGGEEQACQSGALLGETHRVMDSIRANFEPSIEPVVVDSKRASGIKASSGFDQASIDRAGKILAYGEDLVRANAEPTALVHGDWHPGNMIYQGNTIVAVCDFDNTRIGSRMRELAQALVHFSMQTGAKIEPDLASLAAFFDGYRTTAKASPDPRVIASLMPAVLLDEAFASATSTEIAKHASMLSAVLKRAAWMDEHHDILTAQFAR